MTKEEHAKALDYFEKIVMLAIMRRSTMIQLYNAITKAQRALKGRK